jgi:hypothetical protein
VQTLFSFVKARRYLPKDHDEIEAVAVVKDGEGEIEVFTPSELAEILAPPKAVVGAEFDETRTPLGTKTVQGKKKLRVDG